jgi:hypothetical protein
MHAHKLMVNVTEDHRIAIHLPEDFPRGPAEVIILASVDGGEALIQAPATNGAGRPHPRKAYRACERVMGVFRQNHTPAFSITYTSSTEYRCAPWVRP